MNIHGKENTMNKLTKVIAGIIIVATMLIIPMTSCSITDGMPIAQGVNFISFNKFLTVEGNDYEVTIITLPGFRVPSTCIALIPAIDSQIEPSDRVAIYGSDSIISEIAVNGKSVILSANQSYYRLGIVGFSVKYGRDYTKPYQILNKILADR